MVPVGYEPDDKLTQTTSDPDKLYGSVEDYHAMWANFVKIFKEEGVDNVIWIMDYSADVRNHF